jgi:hydrogenase maturation protease
MSRVVVAAVGNRLRGDDAAGPLVVEALRAAHAPVCLVEAATNPLTLLDAWTPDDTVVVVDAVATGARPGTIHELGGADEGMIPDPPGSTHGFGLAAVVELARTLGRLPRQLTVIGIEGARFDLGTPAHPAVRRAARVVAERIMGIARATGG